MEGNVNLNAVDITQTAGIQMRVRKTSEESNRIKGGEEWKQKDDANRPWSNHRNLDIQTVQIFTYYA